MTYSLSRISSSAPVPSSSEPGDAASLRRNVAWALAGNLGYSACQWGVLVCLMLGVTAAMPLVGVGRVVFGLLHKAEYLRRVATSMLAKRVSCVVAVGFVLKLSGVIVLATLAFALCWAGLLVSYDLSAAV